MSCLLKLRTVKLHTRTCVLITQKKQNVLFFSKKKEKRSRSTVTFSSAQHKRLYYGKLNQFRALAAPWAESTKAARIRLRECFYRFIDDAEWKLSSDIFLSPNLTSPDFGRESHQSCSCRTLGTKNEDTGQFFAIEFIILVQRTSRLLDATLDETTKRPWGD